jgi:hypothetical protein
MIDPSGHRSTNCALRWPVPEPRLKMVAVFVRSGRLSYPAVDETVPG